MTIHTHSYQRHVPRLMLVAAVIHLCWLAACDRHPPVQRHATPVPAATTTALLRVSSTPQQPAPAAPANSEVSSVIASNAVLFKRVLTRANLEEWRQAVERLDLTHMTTNKARYLLQKFPGMQSEPVAAKIAMTCKHYAAGSYYFSQLYESWTGTAYVATIGLHWGGFAMRHAEADTAERIYDRAIRDTLALRDARYCSAVTVLMMDKVNLLNMAGRFDRSVVAAEDYYEFVNKNRSHLHAPDVEAETSYFYYVQELYNSGQYDKALRLIAKHRERGDSYAERLPVPLNLIKARSPVKSRVSLGYGSLRTAQ